MKIDLTNKWVTCSWWPDQDESIIHPADIELMKQHYGNAKLFKCVGEEGGYFIITYRDVTIRIKREGLFKITPPPKFNFSDHVRDRSKPERLGTILSIGWHFKDEKHIYMIEVDGKPKTKIYYEKDLELVNTQ